MNHLHIVFHGTIIFKFDINWRITPYQSDYKNYAQTIKTKRDSTLPPIYTTPVEYSSQPGAAICCPKEIKTLIKYALRILKIN